MKQRGQPAAPRFATASGPGRRNGACFPAVWMRFCPRIALRRPAQCSWYAAERRAPRGEKRPGAELVLCSPRVSGASVTLGDSYAKIGASASPLQTGLFAAPFVCRSFTPFRPARCESHAPGCDAVTAARVALQLGAGAFGRLAAVGLAVPCHVSYASPLCHRPCPPNSGATGRSRPSLHESVHPTAKPWPTSDSNRPNDSHAFFSP